MFYDSNSVSFCLCVFIYLIILGSSTIMHRSLMFNEYELVHIRSDLMTLFWKENNKFKGYRS